MVAAALFLSADTVRSQDETWTTFSVADGLPSMEVYSIAASKGEVWAGMEGAVARFEPGNSSWVSMRPPGLQVRVTCIAIGKEDVWFGTYGNGLMRYKSGEWSSYTKNDGLPDNRVEDMELVGGVLYLATTGGASRVSFEGQMPSFADAGKDDGLPDESLTAVSVLGDMVWFGSKANGVLGLDLATLAFRKQVTIADGLSDSRVLALDSDGQVLWVGTGAGGLCSYDPANGSVATFNKSAGLADNLVSCVASNSKIWTGSWGHGVTSIEPGGRMRIYDRSDGLASGDVRDIAVDGKYVWFAAITGGSPTAGGVTRFKGERTGGGGDKLPVAYVLVVVVLGAAVALPIIRRERSAGVDKGRPERRRPYEICGGKSSEELCPFCRYNVVRGGKHHCSKYRVGIPFEDGS